MDAGDDTAFLDAEVEPIAARALAAALSGVAWDEARVTGLASAVVEATIAGLAGLSKPFKYIVNIVLVQNVGGGLYSSVSEYVDAFHDGACERSALARVAL